MKTRSIKLSEIKPYEHNNKMHEERQIEGVANSIKEFGIVQPIVVDKNKVIIIGHCRYEATKRLGLTEFPCVVADIPEEKARALRIIDNKTNESDWIFETLNDEINAIQGINLEELGFSMVDLLIADGSSYADDLDLEDEDYYIANADSQLKAKQVSITYKTPLEKQWLEQRLGIEQLKKVVYQAETLGETE